MVINSKKLDELYNDWSGEHHTTNSNKEVHDSAECTDFAEYCLKYAISEGGIFTAIENNCNMPLVVCSDLSDEIAVKMLTHCPYEINGWCKTKLGCRFKLENCDKKGSGCELCL